MKKFVLANAPAILKAKVGCHAHDGFEDVRRQDLVVRGLGHDGGGDIDAQPGQLLPGTRRLAGVQADTQLRRRPGMPKGSLMRGALEVDRTRHSTTSGIECRQNVADD